MSNEEAVKACSGCSLLTMWCGFMLQEAHVSMAGGRQAAQAAACCLLAPAAPLLPDPPALHARCWHLQLLPAPPALRMASESFSASNLALCTPTCKPIIIIAPHRG